MELYEMWQIGCEELEEFEPTEEDMEPWEE